MSWAKPKLCKNQNCVQDFKKPKAGLGRIAEGSSRRTKPDLGQAVDVALVDQLVVGWVDAALVDAEHVFICGV